MSAEAKAREDAESELIRRYPEELGELYQIECLKHGVHLIRIRRTVDKLVSEADAEILCRNGWYLVPMEPNGADEAWTVRPDPDEDD